MREQSNVIERNRITPGLVLGSLGVLAFSFSLPATRLAVAGMDPWFVAFGRAVVAAVLAIAYLGLTRAPMPSRSQLLRLAVVAFGVVVGFPLFTSLALVTQTASHGAVAVALLPAATAVFAVLRAGERPSRVFWLASGGGLLAVLGFFVVAGGAGGGFEPADLLLLAAILACALGYAEGGALSRELGGARTICWALVVSLPVTVPVTAASLALGDFAKVNASSLFGFGYVSAISMFLGFFAWYAGLARGGVARIGQLQLVQPVLTLLWSALFLGEHPGIAAVGAAVIVLICVALTQRAR
ncbi:DMT family transporter [Allokutzneria sp. NRRL B-24872]|uniref:DMT family transporter n=1 Tax=Allokutzneria sp. NRRL B-24872 TaxID=1137961 RepID=UPI000A3C4BE1|nr:DMT family transporter [Allokutzneria sp. NRRL B-24872]